MKQKIKIMNDKQQPSDEEIQRYMNFDRVLENRKIALQASRVSSIYRWGIPVLMGSLAIIGFLSLQKNDPTPIQPLEQEPVASPQITAPVITPPDSATSLPKKETGKTGGLRKTSDTQAAIVEKKSLEEPDNSGEPVVVEEGYTQAEPLKGYPDLYKYFNDNLVYPATALRDSIQGVQTVSFVINKDGKVEQIQVEQSLGDEFEKESIRLIENMPEWKPAKLDGNPVATRISLPITFQIQKINK